MTEQTFNRGGHEDEQQPRFNRSKIMRLIISILVAIFVWVYVDVEKAPERTKTIYDIPVEFSGENTTLADKNLMLLSGYDTTIDLTIRGPKRELIKLDNTNIRVVAATGSIDTVGVHALTYTTSFPDGVAKNNVSVERASLSQITVTVGELYTKEVPVECEVIGEVAEGYFTGEVVLDPAVLTLRAQRDDLLNVSHAKLTVDITGATRSVVQTVNVQLYDYDGEPVENDNIRTSASLIQARVPVLTTREVPLAVEFSGIPGMAMNSIACNITPRAVRLNGEAEILDSIEKLVLATLYVEDLELVQQNSYVVTPPDGTWLVNGNEVATVEITLEGIEEATVVAENVSYLNMPAGLYAAPTSGVIVRLWGLADEVSEVRGEDVLLTADMSSVTGQGMITVPVTVTVSGFDDVTVRGSYELTVNVTDTPPVVDEPEDEERQTDTPASSTQQTPQTAADGTTVPADTDETQTAGETADDAAAGASTGSNADTDSNTNTNTNTEPDAAPAA